jgi:predicted phage terminase large subunit-like protein
MVSLADMQRIVVAIDPAVTSGDDADETGIIVAGLGVDGFGYVLDDLSCRLPPEGWARRAVNAYRHYQADRIIGESNNGGDLIEATIRTIDRTVSYKKVIASRGKLVRAEPISSLYEQAKVFHARHFPELEDQMCMYVPGTFDGSPDRVDALVWALTDLLVKDQREVYVY